MVSPLSRMQFPSAMTAMMQEKENYEELNQIGNGKIHMANTVYLPYY